LFLAGCMRSSDSLDDLSNTSPAILYKISQDRGEVYLFYVCHRSRIANRSDCEMNSIDRYLVAVNILFV
jgi:hypothetical protein